MLGLINCKAVLFDVDDTLIHVHPSVHETFIQAYRHLGLGIDDEKLKEVYQAALDFYWQEGLKYREDERLLWIHFNEAILHRLGFEGDVRDYAEEVVRFFAENISYRVFPDVEPTLAALSSQGLTLGAITGRIHSTRPILESFGLMKYLDFYLAAGEVGVRKPEAAFYERALRLAGVKASEALLVGNDLTDVEGARNVGITPVLIDRQNQFASADCIRLTDLRQLLSLLGGER